MHDSAAGGLPAICVDGSSGPAVELLLPNPRIVAATAIPIASSVITVNAPLATDFSARTRVTRTISAKNAAAAIVSHMGKDGECQS